MSSSEHAFSAEQNALKYTDLQEGSCVDRVRGDALDHLLKRACFGATSVDTSAMSKGLVDIDDSVFAAAQAEFGTATTKATANEALRRAGEGRTEGTSDALDVRTTAALSDRCAGGADLEEGFSARHSSE